jgi:hypothetical protein
MSVTLKWQTQILSYRHTMKHNFLDSEIYYNIIMASISFCEREGRRERVKQRKKKKKKNMLV